MMLPRTNQPDNGIYLSVLPTQLQHLFMYYVDAVRVVVRVKRDVRDVQDGRQDGQDHVHLLTTEWKNTVKSLI